MNRSKMLLACAGLLHVVVMGGVGGAEGVVEAESVGEGVARG